MTPLLNLLVAFPFINARIMAHLESLDGRLRYLSDSGAFSAFNAGKAVVLEDYCRFLETVPVKPWRYFNLDVIGDPEGSDRNYQIMLDRGLRPIPIFTRGASLDELDRMYETSDVIGVGGLVNKSTPYRYIKAVSAYIGARHAHLLGFVSPTWIQYLKPYSCDATSFNRVTRFGYLDIYLGDGRFAHYTTREAAKGPPSGELRRAIANAGFDPYALQSAEHWKTNGVARWLSVYSWVRFSLDLERRFGTLLFLAAGEDDLPVLIACFRAIVDGTDLEAARRASPSKRQAA